jgi:hypothetical protein
VLEGAKSRVDRGSEGAPLLSLWSGEAAGMGLRGLAMAGVAGAELVLLRQSMCWDLELSPRSQQLSLKLYLELCFFHWTVGELREKGKGGGGSFER